MAINDTEKQLVRDQNAAPHPLTKVTLAGSAQLVQLVGAVTVDDYKLTVPLGAQIGIFADVLTNWVLRNSLTAVPGVTLIANSNPGAQLAALTWFFVTLGPYDVALDVLGATGNLMLYYMRSAKT